LLPLSKVMTAAASHRTPKDPADREAAA
jgi:hypothetical protein